MVKAFNTIFADVMKSEKFLFGGTKATAFICGNHEGANRTDARVADDIGFEALLVGVMSNARYLEGMAHLNIQLAVRMGGGTDVAFKYLNQSNVLAELRGWTQVVARQTEYNLGERTAEGDLPGMAESHGMSILDWSPLKMGALTGKYLADGQGDFRLNTPSLDPELQKLYRNDRVNGIAREVVTVARELGRSPAQVALNWILGQSPRHIPIIGARTRAQPEDNLGCLGFALPDAYRQRLDEISRPQLSFPHPFLRLEHIRESVLGEHCRENLLRNGR